MTRAFACLLFAALAPLALLAGPRLAAADPWVAPLAGPLRSVHPFAPPAHRWSAGHRGVDLVGTPGAVVRAAGAGQVTFAGLLAGRGVVVVRHRDGTRTTYEPVTAVVAVSDRVAAGDPIGRLAGAGGHCLPAACLHWGHLDGAVYLDPMALLRSHTVRLLPVWTGPAGAGSPVARDATVIETPGGRAPSTVAGRHASIAAPQDSGGGRGPRTGLAVVAATASLGLALTRRDVRGPPEPRQRSSGRAAASRS